MVASRPASRTRLPNAPLLSALDALARAHDRDAFEHLAALIALHEDGGHFDSVTVLHWEPRLELFLPCRTAATTPSGALTAMLERAPSLAATTHAVAADALDPSTWRGAAGRAWSIGLSLFGEPDGAGTPWSSAAEVLAVPLGTGGARGGDDRGRLGACPRASRRARARRSRRRSASRSSTTSASGRANGSRTRRAPSTSGRAARPGRATWSRSSTWRCGSRCAAPAGTAARCGCATRTADSASRSRTDSRTVAIDWCGHCKRRRAGRWTKASRRDPVPRATTRRAARRGERDRRTRAVAAHRLRPRGRGRSPFFASIRRHRRARSVRRGRNVHGDVGARRRTRRRSRAALRRAARGEAPRARAGRATAPRRALGRAGRAVGARRRRGAPSSLRCARSPAAPSASSRPDIRCASTSR